MGDNCSNEHRNEVAVFPQSPAGSVRRSSSTSGRVTLRGMSRPWILPFGLVGSLAFGALPGAPTLAAQRAAPPPALSPTALPPRDSVGPFAKLVAELSEPGGYFDTDNLISNERSYLHVLGALDRLKVRGGAYVGVGPDQNFSYIARIKPRIAFIVDIRRDNMLQQLLFKALFARSRNRAEYLALLLGRPVPANVESLAGRPIEQLVTYIDSLRVTAASSLGARQLVQAEVARFDVPLSAKDWATMARFHAEFIAAGLSLRFTSAGRPPQWYYPTLRELVLERDLTGRAASYLASESDFQFVKTMQRDNLVIPVVGDLAGSHAMPAIAQLMRARGDKLSAIYASNAEDYVMRGGGFGAYARNVLAMPRDARSVFIRSWFGGEGSHPENVAGYHSTQLLQTVDDFAADMKTAEYVSYRDLVNRHFVPLR